MNQPANDAGVPRDVDRLEELIVLCLECMETEGEAALDALCTQHPEQAAALRSRMRALREAGLVEVAPGDAAVQFPERLGDFRLLAHLGGGGMGVVYLARQESLGREVALKLIRPEHLYFPGARERFRREVETVARLAHPGIAPIYTVGEERGIPYFAMERVVGCSLADVVERLQASAPARLRGVDCDRAIAACIGAGEAEAPAALFAGSWNDTCVRIVREVAEALEYVHRRAVLHRDVKPSNVMVTRTGRVMLVDFGLSSAEGGERLTRSGVQVGSLAYMSPEQVRGDAAAVNARSDVYSLGATLYELLTLRLPFAAAGGSELRRQIVETRPAAPRGRNPAIDRDLETVCLHAMASDPAHRYATAEAFAHDLTCVLERRPIAARRAGVVGRAVRWARRQPALAAVVLLTLALVTVVPSVLYWQQRLANQAIEAKNAEIETRNQALAAALQDAGAQRSRAERNLSVALTSVDAMARIGAQDLEQVPQLEPVRARLLESALALNEKLAANQGDAGSEARAALAETRRRTGDIYHWLGRFDDAVREFELAIAELRVLRTQRRSDDGDVALARVLDALARTQRSLGRREASAESSRETIELLAALPAEGEAGLGIVEQRAHALHFRATTLLLLGQVEPALAAHRESVDLARQLFARDPTPDREAMVAGHLGAMGSSLLESGKTEPSEVALREACTIYARVLATPAVGEAGGRQAGVRSAKTYKENYADAATNLGVLHQNAQDLDAATPHFERAFAIYGELVADYPSSPRYLDSLNSARTNLAALHMRAPDSRDRGMALMREAVASQQSLVARFPKSTEYRTLLAMMVGNLGTYEFAGGDAELGCQLLGEAVAQHGKLLGEQPGNPVLQARVTVFGLKLANIHLQRGESQPAAAALRTTEALAASDWITLRRIAGQTVDASEKAKRDPALAPNDREVQAQRLLDHAIDLMERSIAGGYRDVEDLEKTPLFAPLRASPRYAALRAKVPAAK